ncbi:MAG: hypothetical protein U0326_34050 [Polyangiales bacterium]
MTQGSEASDRGAPRAPVRRGAWRFPWLRALIVATLCALVGTPLFAMIVPASMRGTAPILCPSGTVRTTVSYALEVSEESSSTAYTLWCIDGEGVRERVGEMQLFGVLAAEFFVAAFALVALVGASRREAAVAALALLATVPGCTWGTMDEASLNATTRGYCHSSRGAQRALADLGARVGGPLRARTLTLYADVVMGEFFDPRNPDRANAWRWYVFTGTGTANVEAPSPVPVRAGESDPIDVARFRWDRVSAMVTTTLDRAHTAGASISTISIARDAAGLRFRVRWIAPHASGEVDFDHEARLMEETAR